MKLGLFGYGNIGRGVYKVAQNLHISYDCTIKKVFDLPIYRFYDIYFRLNKIDSYNQTMTAYCSGNIDTSKSPLNMEKINWSAIITQK